MNPRLKIIVGGTDPTFRPDFYLNFVTERNHGLFDLVILGEGEIAGPKLLQHLASKSDIPRIHGVAHATARGMIDVGIERNCNLMMNHCQRWICLLMTCHLDNAD